MGNVLITGVTSPIGEAAVNWCLKNSSSCKLFALGRNVEKLSLLENRYNISTAALDFSLDEKEFKERVNELNLPRIDKVFHFIAAIPEFTKTPTEFYKVNFINARIFFDTIPLANESCVLNTSTSSVYDQQQIYLTESTLKSYSNDYGISKLMFEKYLTSKVNRNLAEELSKSSEHKLTILNVRIPILIVPGVKHNFISKWRYCIRNDKAVTLFNYNSMFNSCVWGEDIFDFFKYYCMNYKNKELTCNVGADEPITISNAFDILMRLYSKKNEFKISNSDKPSQYYDSSYAIEFGYKPHTVSEILHKYHESDKCHYGLPNI